ncbi:MAG: hypothetical protein A2231_00510 [Candidatus Firestonebacteria bacterium RIFOXYA2_FULL_40_8]|nr:MAG: hypothetical protein A2231_00510 [Candidatus Firestonebacteria bacterium RIFOXYA2_FULL_40_8]
MGKKGIAEKYLSKDNNVYLNHTLIYLGLLGLLVIILMLISLSPENPYYIYVVIFSLAGSVLAVSNILFVYESQKILSSILGVLFIIPIMFFVVWATGGSKSPYWILMLLQIVGWAFFVPNVVFFSAVGVICVFLFGLAYSDTVNTLTALDYFYESVKIAAVLLTGLWMKSIIWEMQRSKKNDLESLEFKNKITQKLLSSFIASLSTAIARKDADIQKHSERVISYCSAIADVLKLPEADREKLYMAAMLHDVGKMSISDNILNKKGKLTKQEFEIIKRHPMDALSILEHVEEFKGVLIYVKYHHERWDGKGYPEGLKGDMIPLIARVLVVANAYDAMTTDRPHKAKMSKTEAILELGKCRGTQFDPKIVDIFLRILDSGKLIGPI